MAEYISIIVSVLVALIGAAASIAATVITVNGTKSKILSELAQQNALQNAEIVHIKQGMEAMSKRIDEHNGYAKLFAENIPVIKERIAVSSIRITDLEQEMKEVRKDA